MKKPFETYLSFIENQLGVQLLCWQKMVLQAIYDGHYPYVSGVRCGKSTMIQAVDLLRDEIARDVGDLPSWQYELDGYTTNIVTYDDDIKWKKEN